MAIHFEIFNNPCHDAGYGDWAFFTIDVNGKFTLFEEKPFYENGKWLPPNEDCFWGTLWTFECLPNLPADFNAEIALFEMSFNTLKITDDNWKTLVYNEPQ